MHVLVRGVSQDLPMNLTAVQVALKTDYWPVLASNEMKMSQVDLDCFLFKDDVFPDEIRIKAHDGKVELENLFGIGRDASLQVVALAYDEFSGARRCFVQATILLKI